MLGTGLMLVITEVRFCYHSLLDADVSALLPQLAEL